MYGLLIDRIFPNLSDISRLERVSSEVSSEATTCIESDRIAIDSHSILRPVSIDHLLRSTIGLIPWPSMDSSDKSSYLSRCRESIVGMYTSMHENKFLLFYERRKSEHPFSIGRELITQSPIFTIHILIKFCLFSEIFWSPFCSKESVIIVLHIVVLMIPDHTPCIRSIVNKFDYFERFRSLVDQISDEVEMILWCESDLGRECYEFIVAAMDITDEEGS